LHIVLNEEASGKYKLTVRKEGLQSLRSILYVRVNIIDNNYNYYNYNCNRFICRNDYKINLIFMDPCIVV